MPENQINANRLEPDQAISAESVMEYGFNSAETIEDSSDWVQNPNRDSGSNPNYEIDGSDNCSEEELEEILMKKLDFLYKEAVSELSLRLGSEKEVALKAILTYGYCFGEKDVMSNIMKNCLIYMNSETNEKCFADLRQLAEFCLGGLIEIIQKLKPDSSRSDAMRCLLISNLHMRRATMIDPAMYNVESVGTNFDGVLSQNENAKNQDLFNVALNNNFDGVLSQNENSKNEDLVNVVLNRFLDMNLDENVKFVPGDQKEEMILDLINQINDLEKQVKERRKWAQETALKAARKLCDDLSDLKMLRMEREENQRLKERAQQKPTSEDLTEKRFSEMESAFWKVNEQFDRTIAAVERLETENAEIRANMEALKLSASESATSYLEVLKREKKFKKRILAWDKQKAKMQEEIAAEKQKISEIQHQMVGMEASLKDAEAKWREEQKAKEQAAAQLKEEIRLKEETEASIKTRQEALRLKLEIDFQRQKDDLKRLEQELSRLKSSAELTQQSANPQAAENFEETIARLLDEMNNLDESSEKEAGSNRKCMICRDGEVSVVFLPCAHQVLCVNCNEECVKKGESTCPCCSDPIEQRIRVFGPTSS